MVGLEGVVMREVVEGMFAGMFGEGELVGV